MLVTISCSLYRLSLFNGQESWAMYYITQEKKCNVAKRFTASYMRSSYNCKIDSIHQTDSIVATRACAVATKSQSQTMPPSVCFTYSSKGHAS